MQFLLASGTTSLHCLLCCKYNSHLLHLIPLQFLPLALINFYFTKTSPPVPRAKHGGSLGWREGGADSAGATAGCAGQRRDLVTRGGIGKGRPGTASSLAATPVTCWVRPTKAASGERGGAGAESCGQSEPQQGRELLPWAGRSCTPAGAGKALLRAPPAAPPAAGRGEGAAARGPPGGGTQPDHPSRLHPVRQRGWQALFLAVRRAQQLLSKKGRAATVTMTGNLPATSRALKERCSGRSALPGSDKTAPGIRSGGLWKVKYGQSWLYLIVNYKRQKEKW